MPWPFGPDDDMPAPFPISEDAKPKRKTKKDKLAEQEELIQTLKFTPRTYRVMLSGYGGEIVLGSVHREQYEYFRDNEIDIEEYAWDCDNEQEVPEEMQPFTPGEWHSCDDVAHESGCELSEYNYITVTDENGKEHSIYTGDTLFIGDVGRPDLAVKTDRTQEDLAGFLFDSLRNKIMPLSDDLIVYPGHGAGSACGRGQGARYAVAEHAPVRGRSACQQCPFVGCARHGEIKPCQGNTRGCSCWT